MRIRLLAVIAFVGIPSGYFALAKAPPAVVASASTPATVATPVATSAAPVGTPERPVSKAQTDFFESKVRPILVSKCYECHSNDQHKSKGGLLLDSRDTLRKGGKHGPAVVPGNPGKSLLIKAIGYGDADLQMPPDDKLKDGDIAILRQWIEMGAPDPRTTTVSKLTGLTDKARAHWSYQPVKNPSIPVVKNIKWVKNPVDSFVLAKLEKNQIEPSAPATREALIRRATYDLIGLPPTPEEVEAFVNDASADAFTKVVDRLLASNHFGERWGRYWLDTARYSDTSGEDKIKSDYRYPYAWTYRDYVIDSFNDDKPYDVFLKEQLAADLLPDSAHDPARLAALGFLTVGKRFQNPNDTIDERIDAVSKGMLGMTVSCARCHDHKFDPIPQADYYSLHGVFSSTFEPSSKPIIGGAGQNEAYQDFLKQYAELENNNKDLYYTLIQNKAREFRKDAAAYIMVATIGKKNNAEEIILRNKIISEHHLDRDVYQGGARSFRANMDVFGPMFELAQLTPDQFPGGVRRVLDEIASGGSKRRPINPAVTKTFAGVSADSLRSMQDVANIYGKLFAAIDEQADVYLTACRTAKTVPVKGFAPALVELCNVPAEIEFAPNLTTERLTEIAPTLPVVNQQGYARLNLSQINELLLTHPGSPPHAMIVADLEKPKNSPIFIRGEAQNHGPIVPRQFLEILAGPHRKPFTKGSGRLELAQAIASKENPMTARVVVNRIWMHLFGQGFVRTPDDLGVQCEDPSHPELLDYLSRQFMNNGWSVKKEIRTIMLSNTYQQSSDTNPEYATKDPENRLVWRANLRRLDFEAMRDSLLMFTGKLDPTLGGKPVNLTDEPYSNRRSVYGYIDRGNLPELLSQFDFADPDMANSRRTSTIVPQQALFFMNNPMSVDVARKVTTRPEFLAATDAPARITALYAVLFQRAPRSDEVQFGMDFIQSASEEDGDASGKPQTAAQIRQARQAEARATRQQQQLEANLRKQQGKANARTPVRNYTGTIVDRHPLTPWEEYAQALLFTNEIAYEN